MAKKLSKKQITIYAVAALALLAVGAAAYVHYSPTKNSPKTVTPTETPASLQDKGTNHPGQGSASGSGSNSGSTSTTSPTPQTDPQYSSSTLAKPTQTFNKSHTPISLSQTDSTKPDYPALDSTCSTIEGATCEIHATLSGTTKTVAGPKTVTDTTTGVDLPWNASDEGLTQGTWTIVAVAKYNGQIATSDSTTLVVNP